MEGSGSGCASVEALASRCSLVATCCVGSAGLGSESVVQDKIGLVSGVLKLLGPHFPGNSSSLVE